MTPTPEIAPAAASNGTGTAVATAPAPAAPAPAPAPLQPKFKKMIDTMNGVIFERKRETETSVLALVSGKHHLQVGPPGVAKTYLVDILTKLIDGVQDQYFRWLMTRFTTPEEIFGPPSLKALENDEYRRNTLHKLPDALLVFLDEWFKANSSILNSLLTIMNEGLFFNNGIPIPCAPTFYGASNELPREAELAALWDRVSFRHEVQPLKNGGNRKKMLKLRIAGATQSLAPVVTWDEVLQARAEVKTINVPDLVIEKLIELQDALKKEGVEPTDRRMSDCMPIIQATAWLNGRTDADVDDLKPLQHVLWVDLKDQPVVNKLVLALANPIDKEAMELLETVEKLASEADALLRNQDNKQKRRQQGVEIHGKLERCSEDLDKLAEQANKGAKRSEMIEEARQRIAAVASTLLRELFGIDDTGA